jgi:hypothetical protein
MGGLPESSLRFSLMEYLMAALCQITDVVTVGYPLEECLGGLAGFLE